MKKFKEFLRITSHLNSDLNITPVLYGSLGLSRILNKSLDSKDIDILVPQKYITTKWKSLIRSLQKINYQLTNEEEHEFIYLDNRLGVAFEEDLFPFAKVDHKNLKIISDKSAAYKILDISQYKKVYEISKNDSYRSQKNNKKDIEKIRLIDNYIKSGGPMQ